MGQAEITDKVAAHLRRHAPMTEECHVVYFLVEMRKHCERSGYEDDLLKFYADWALHPRKNKLSPKMRTYIQDLHTAVRRDAQERTGSAELVEFCRLTDFRRAVRRWMIATGISTALVDELRCWTEFRRHLIGVLAHQEIAPLALAGGLGIYFEGASGSCVARFRTPIAGSKTLKADP